MRHIQRHGGPAPHLFAIMAVALVALFALAPSPAVARAYVGYQRGGSVECPNQHVDADVRDCEICHLHAHSDIPPTDQNCLTCHTGYQTVRAQNVCWTCHAPGQDMSWARTDASCLSTCHMPGGVDFTHTTHAGGAGACTSCHPLTASRTDPAGSPHHVVPAPRLDTVAPSAGAPGAGVTLTGAKLTWVKLVRFGGIDAAFTVQSDGRIVATVPDAAVSGAVTVASLGGTATSAAPFTVLRPTPARPALTLAAAPRAVKLGRRVQIKGTIAPADAAAQVKVVVQRRVAGVWKAAGGSLRAPAAGGYAWAYRAKRVGAYRARAVAAGASSGWAPFRVR